MTGYPCGFCYRVHRSASLVGEAHAWQDGTPVAPWRTYPIKPLRLSTETPTADPSAPHVGRVRSGVSVDVRRRTLASSG